MKREDWATEKAREWYDTVWPRAPKEVKAADCETLAVLLREVRDECVCGACGSTACHESEQ